jgi:hypothetical protein
VDIDADGHNDILSGSYSRTDGDMAGLFHVLRGKADKTFEKAEPLKGTDGEPLIIPADQKTQIENICTRPFAVDWDGDDDLDLVVGNFAGSFYLFRGEGKGKFNPKCEPINTGDKPLKIAGHHSDPFVVDWDGDGDLDLLSGASQGGFQWAENSAGKGKEPEFDAFQAIVKPVPPKADDPAIVRDKDLTGPATGTRIWVDDVNADGKLDILVGDLVNLTSPVGDLSEEEFKKKQAELVAEMAKARQAMTEAKDETAQSEAIERYQKLYTQRSQFVKEERTGFVWLYLQK